MKTPVQYKPVLLLSAAYLLILVLFWFKPTKTLFAPRTLESISTGIKGAALLILFIYAAFGVIREAMLSKPGHQKRYYVLVKIIVYVVCALFIFIPIAALGILNFVYMSYCLLSYYYGIYVMKEFLRNKKGAGTVTHR